MKTFFYTKIKRKKKCKENEWHGLLKCKMAFLISVPRLYGDRIPTRVLTPSNKKVQRKIVLYHNFFRTHVKPSAANMLVMVRVFFSNVSSLLSPFPNLPRPCNFNRAFALNFPPKVPNDKFPLKTHFWFLLMIHVLKTSELKVQVFTHFNHRYRVISKEKKSIT